MYTCSSPTLVRLSALRCFRWPAMLSFSSSFITFIQSYFVCRFFFFFFCLPIDSFELQMFVCLFSLSWSWWFCPCSFIFVGQSPGAFVTLWTRLGELLLCDHTTEQFGLFFFSLCTVVVTLFDLPFFGSCIIPFFHTASATKDLALKNWSWTSVHIGSCCLLSDWMEREYCTFSSMQLSLSPCIIPTRGSEG